MTLTKEQIFAADDLQPVEVDVPQWGGTVKIRCLMASQRAELEREYSLGNKRPEEDPGGFRCALLTRTVVDDQGDLVFDNNGDVVSLLKKNAAAVEIAFKASADLNGFTEKDQEELAKN